MREWVRARTVCLAGCLVLLAACSGEGGGGDAGAKGDTLAVTPEAAEADPMGNARRVLGDGVLHARSFKLDRENERFILALLDAADEVRDPADSAALGPGAYEAVLIEARPEGFAILKPGLYAGAGLESMPDAARVAAPPAAELAERIVGTEDATGDGYVEVWTALRRFGPRSFSIRVQAYNRLNRGVYWISARSVEASGALTGPGADLALDPASYRYSATADTLPAMREWLARKAGSAVQALNALPPPGSP
ncbi:MAG TPA: hypothetical protein VFQ45_22990 [Longimicrobium sp.]|nr:hypothetical protein [Longimicrobium sp.]